ncbi:MAG: KEOPS complex kinase/ATPase Bud32 [Candidatus Woesearchaeota archaeon]|jgi:Kae1-associated kinase Bud32
MHKIGQGAEAVIYRDADRVIKERLSKGYRIPQIDRALRGFRTRREAKVMQRLEEMNFPAPRLLGMSDKDMTLTMDFISGSKLRDVIEEGDVYQQLAREMGEKIGQLHLKDIIHGDLTTSNILVRQGELVFIDFGLSFFSEKVEDKAVDLFLLNRALESKHYHIYPDVFEKALEGYYESYPEAKAVLERYNAVMKRGRNKK